MVNLGLEDFNHADRTCPDQYQETVKSCKGRL